jgi:uncharacterized protein (TIGR00369 family)
MNLTKEMLLELFNEKAPIADCFGMKLSYDDKDRANIALSYNPDLDHAGGAVHGGVIATLLDNAGWFTCAMCCKCMVLTSEISVHFLRPAVETGLRAQGEMLKKSRRQAVAQMHCWDEAEALVAHGTGTFLLRCMKTALGEPRSRCGRE